MAKFHFRELVTQTDVDMAIKLMDFSFETLEKIDKDDTRHTRRDRKWTLIIVLLLLLISIFIL